MSKKKTRRGIKIAKNTNCFKAKHRKTIGCFLESIGCLCWTKCVQALKNPNPLKVDEKAGCACCCWAVFR